MDYRMNEEAPYEMTAMQKAWKIFRAAKKGTRVVAIIPPAVRVAMGEYFSFARGEDAFGKIAAALREIGADIVADGALGTDFAVERTAKLLSERLKRGETFPLILSSPAWAETVKEKYPEAAENIVAFTPALQFAALIKRYFNALGDGKKTKVIIVAPCEVESEEDILVLTTQELAVMFQSADINVRMLKNSAADEPFVAFSGAGVLPAVAGGLSESVVRSLTEDKSEETFRKLEYSGLRGRKPFREAKLSLGGKELKIAVAYSGEEADSLAERIFADGAKYDFIEIAECAGGCIMGEGQSCADEMTEKLRAAGIYRLDRRCRTKSAGQNISVAWLEALALAEPAPEPDEPEYEEEPIPETASVIEIAAVKETVAPALDASDTKSSFGKETSPIVEEEKAEEATEQESVETATEESDAEKTEGNAEENFVQEAAEESETVGEDTEEPTSEESETLEKEEDVCGGETVDREETPEAAEEFTCEADASENREGQSEKEACEECSTEEAVEEVDLPPVEENAETIVETSENTEEVAEEAAEASEEEARLGEAAIETNGEAAEISAEEAAEETFGRQAESEEKEFSAEEDFEDLGETDSTEMLSETEGVEKELALADDAEDVLEEDTPLEELFEEGIAAEEEIAVAGENGEAETEALGVGELSSENTESMEEAEESGAVQETIEEILEETPSTESVDSLEETVKLETSATAEEPFEESTEEAEPVAKNEEVPAENEGMEAAEDGEAQLSEAPSEAEESETNENFIESVQEAEKGTEAIEEKELVESFSEEPIAEESEMPAKEKPEEEEELPTESDSIEESGEEVCTDSESEEAEEDETEENGENEAAPAKGNVPYHTTLSRKERRKLKRMRKFRR